MNLVGDLLNKYKCYVVIDFIIIVVLVIFNLYMYLCMCMYNRSMYVYNAVFVWL